MTDLDQRVITPLPASHPELGRWLWAMMQDTRRRTLDAIQGVTQEELDWTPPGLKNGIGTLRYHPARIETAYLCMDILGLDDYLPDLEALLPWPDRDESGELVVVTGVSLDQHMARLETVRRRFLERVSTLTAEQMDTPRAFPDWGYAITPAWTLHHLMQHEAEHRGEINGLRALYRVTT